MRIVKTSFLGPGWGQRFVAHRVSGGSHFALTAKPRGDRRCVEKTRRRSCEGFCRPYRGLSAFVQIPTAYAVGYKSAAPSGAKKLQRPGRTSFLPPSSGAVYRGSLRKSMTTAAEEYLFITVRFSSLRCYSLLSTPHSPRSQ